MRRHSIFGTTSVIYRYSKKYFMKKAEKLEFAECHPPYLLTIADMEGCDQEAVANKLHINKGRVARVIRELESTGYVRREHPEDDKRRNLLYLTDKARVKIPQLNAFEDDFNDTITKGMTVEQKKTFMALLDIAAVNALEEMQEPFACELKKKFQERQGKEDK